MFYQTFLLCYEGLKLLTRTKMDFIGYPSNSLNRIDYWHYARSVLSNSFWRSSSYSARRTRTVSLITILREIIGATRGAGRQVRLDGVPTTCAYIQRHACKAGV